MSSAVKRHERIIMLCRNGGAAAKHDDSHPYRPYHHSWPENHKHDLCQSGDHREDTRNTEKHTQVASRSGKPSRSQGGQAEQQHP